MRKGVLLAFLTIAMLAIALAVWWVGVDRAAVPPPPALSAAVAIDPQLKSLIDAALADVYGAPADAAARMRLAMIYHANGLSDLAEATYAQCVEIDSHNAKAWYHLGRLLADRGELDEALSCIDRSISFDSTHAPSHWRRGYWLLDIARYDEAENSFRAAIRINTSDVAAHVGLARIAMAHGRFVESATILEQFLSQSPPPPNVAYIRQLLGMAYRQLERISGAHSALALAEGAGVSWPDEWAGELQPLRVGYAATLERAAGLIAAGHADEAIKLLSALVRAKPADMTAINTLAQAFMAKGEIDSAIDVLRKATALAPNNAPTLINLSVAFERKQQMDQAIAHALAAVNAQPTLGPARLQLGRLLVLSNQIQAAESELSHAVRLGVTDPQVRVMLGNVLLELKRWDEAGRVLEQALAVAPDNSAAHVALARAAMEIGSFDQAKSLLDRARQLNPSEQMLTPAQVRLNQLQSGSSSQ